MLPTQCMEKYIYNTQVNQRFYAVCCLKSLPKTYSPLQKKKRKKHHTAFDCQQAIWFPTGVTTKQNCFQHVKTQTGSVCSEKNHNNLLLLIRSTVKAFQQIKERSFSQLSRSYSLKVCYSVYKSVNVFLSHSVRAVISYHTR